MSIDPAIHHIRRIDDELQQLKARMERMVRPGTVPMEGGLDYSDPKKPRARIQHGVNDDGTPALGPWLPHMTHAGEMNRWSPLSPGQQMVQFSPDGVFENGILIPLGHSQEVPAPSTDKDRHVDQFGDHRVDTGKQDHTRTIGSTSDHQDMNDKRVNVGGKIEHTAGDPAAAGSSGAPAAGGLMPHELNRTLQSIIARLGQHDHFHAAHHDQMSIMVDLALSKIPAYAGLLGTLNHTGAGLQAAAQQVLPRLPDFMSMSLLQTVEKLATTFLGGVVEQVTANTTGQISGLLGQVSQQLSGAGLSDAQQSTAASLMAAAQSAAPAAASGASFELGVQTQGLANLAAGTPAASQVSDLIGQIRGIMSSTGGLMSGLSGLLDSQDNAAKGTIKSMLLGGYG